LLRRNVGLASYSQCFMFNVDEIDTQVPIWRQFRQRFLYKSAFLAPKFCTKALLSSYVLAKKDFRMKNEREKR